MSNGRHTKPLFELLRDESSEGRRGARAPVPTITPEVKPPRPAPSPAREPLVRDTSTRPTPAADSVPREAPLSIRGGVVAMSVYGAYLALAGVLAVTVIVWVVAYNSGRRAAEHEMASRIQADLPPGVTDPRTLVQPPRDPLQDAPVRGEQPVPRPEPSPSKASLTPSRVALGRDDIITPGGSLASDPRTPKLNYQGLAYALPQDEAREMVIFLGKGGLDVIGVPVKVDRTGSGDNNSPLYKVVATLGLTSDQYKNNDPLRARQESEVRRLGQLWKKSKVGRGPLDPTYWENLKP